MGITVGQVILIVVGAAGFWTFLGKLFDAWLEKRKRKRDKSDKDVDQSAAIAKLNVTADEHTKQLTTLQDGVMLLLFDRFEHCSSRYIEQGEITLRQLSVLTSMYNSYKKLGGDGWCDELMEIARNLPIKQ